ncbi:hypothetical protein ACA910_005141 [Epithemia clementina (nom. ined.)]
MEGKEVHEVEPDEGPDQLMQEDEEDEEDESDVEEETSLDGGDKQEDAESKPKVEHSKAKVDRIAVHPKELHDDFQEAEEKIWFMKDSNSDNQELDVGANKAVKQGG